MLLRHQAELKVAVALHDADMLGGGAKGNYSRRSAILLREQVRPSLLRTVNDIDRGIGLVLDETGPGVETYGFGALWGIIDFIRRASLRCSL